MAVGYIYALSNPMIMGLLKVGFTCGSVDRRRRELSGATGIPTEFVIEYFELTDDVEEIENLVHAELESHRVADNREFFRAPIDHVVAAIQRHARQPANRFQRPISVPKEPPSSLYSCRRCGFQYAKAMAPQLCPSCGF